MVGPLGEGVGIAFKESVFGLFHAGFGLLEELIVGMGVLASEVLDGVDHLFGFAGGLGAEDSEGDTWGRL